MCCWLDGMTEVPLSVIIVWIFFFFFFFFLFFLFWSKLLDFGDVNILFRFLPVHNLVR